MKQTLTSRQLMTLSFVSMLSPFLRLIPGSITDIAGAVSWVSAALSFIPTMFLSITITALLSQYPSGTGLAQIILQTFGPFLGSLILRLWAIWLLFHSGFLLCSGADRFIATIYPGIQPTIFILVTASICLIAALGKIKALGRASEIFQPLLLFVILLVVFFSISDIEINFLLPITASQTKSILKGIPQAAEAVSVVLVNIAFLSKFTCSEFKSHNRIPWLIGVTLLCILFCVVCVGNLGKTYVSALAYPFFILARDLSILSGVERIESLVVGLWFVPDFVLITVELMIASDIFLIITNKQNSIPARNGWIFIGIAFSVFVAFHIVPNSEQLVRWSEKIIPTIHLTWAYIAIPLIVFIHKLRQKF